MGERIASRCVCCDGDDLDRSPAVLMPFVAHRAFGWTPVEITADWGLRTLKTGMAYPLCASLQCRRCGLVFLDIRFSETEMAALYADYRGPAYAAARDAFEPGYAALNAAILADVPCTRPAEAFLAGHVKVTPRVLDWGGDNGRNTPFAATAGGLDIFDISGRPVVEGARRVGRSELADARYDLVVLSHVLEHAPAPKALIDEAASVLADDGVLYVEVPYEALIAAAPESRQLAARKKHWHEHVNFFTEAAIRALAARCGLQVLALEVRDFASLANIDKVLSVALRRRPDDPRSSGPDTDIFDGCRP